MVSTRGDEPGVGVASVYVYGLHARGDEPMLPTPASRDYNGSTHVEMNRLIQINIGQHGLHAMGTLTFLSSVSFLINGLTHGE